MQAKIRKRQRGAALIIGLILLAIITLLAVVGMNIANTELASATSEQIRLRAFQASEAGIEYALVEMGDTPTDGADHESDLIPVAGSPKDIDDNAIDTYKTTITYRGWSPAPQFSEKDFVAVHYSLVSEGRSSRDAIARHETGAYKVQSNGGGTVDFGALPPE
jgi:hypothetical protein